MTPQTRIRNISLLLTFVAGYCDTVTFLAANEVFSAHVTGNFILLAHDVVHRSDGETWTKLLTFPVFVAAVMAGGWRPKSRPGSTCCPSSKEACCC